MSTVTPEQVTRFVGNALRLLFWAIGLGFVALVVAPHFNDIVPFMLACVAALWGLVGAIPLPGEHWLLLVLGVMVFINMRKLDRIGRQISAVVGPLWARCWQGGFSSRSISTMPLG
jgi:hypothetical protein